jgi:hypothetical protein
MMHICSHGNVPVQIREARAMEYEGGVIGYWWHCPACQGWHFSISSRNGGNGNHRDSEERQCEDTPTRSSA